MPQFNYKANNRTDRAKKAVALKRAKKERPVKAKSFAHFKSRIVHPRTVRHDIEDN